MVDKEEISEEASLVFNRLRTVANVAAGAAAVGVLFNSKSTLFELLGRLVHFDLQRIDYVYLAIYLMLLVHGFFWFHFGNQENEHIIAWVKPKHYVPERTFGHQVGLVVIAVLFVFLFWSVTDFLTFIILYTIYGLVDIFQFYLKRKDLKRMLTTYSNEIKCRDPFVSETIEESDPRCEALSVLYRFNFVRPILRLHSALVTVSFLLACAAIFRVGSPDVAIVAGYLTLIVAFTIHEIVLWSWRTKMKSELTRLRSGRMG